MIFKKFYTKLFVIYLGKQFSEVNDVRRELELKEQELQKSKLYIKDLEYAKENFLEFQVQAKVCLINFFEVSIK